MSFRHALKEIHLVFSWTWMCLTHLAPLQVPHGQVQVDCRAYSAAMGGAPWTKSAALLQDLQWQLEALGQNMAEQVLKVCEKCKIHPQNM